MQWNLGFMLKLISLDFSKIKETTYSNKLALIKDIELYEPSVRVLRASVTYTNTEAKIYIMLQRRDTLETLSFNEYISL